mgnify:CR=1 FL=1
MAYRGGGATAAAKHGAVASFVRAVGPMGLRTPHTGGMNYGDGVAKIPTAAIAAEDANRIQRLSDRGLRVLRKGDRVHLTTAPQAAPHIERFLGLDLSTKLSQAA